MILTVKLLNIYQYTKTFQTYGKIHNMYKTPTFFSFYYYLK